MSAAGRWPGNVTAPIGAKPITGGFHGISADGLDGFPVRQQGIMRGLQHLGDIQAQTGGVAAFLVTGARKTWGSFKVIQWVTRSESFLTTRLV